MAETKQNTFSNIHIMVTQDATGLEVLIPFWKSSKKPVITLGNTLHIKLGGGGRNV
ncbi:7513_t:CDS:2 [Entrophospora sp. SA101]|nr:7513_t:CDS:2 [Entrophospora sp. SA101]